jgi:hypothetical protein
VVPIVLRVVQLPRDGVIAPRKLVVTVRQPGVMALRDVVIVLPAGVMVLKVVAVTADRLDRPST